MRGKHWFSLAQTHMAPQPKPKSEGRDCQKESRGSNINTIVAPRGTQKRPRRAKSSRKGSKCNEKERKGIDMSTKKAPKRAQRNQMTPSSFENCSAWGPPCVFHTRIFRVGCLHCSTLLCFPSRRGRYTHPGTGDTCRHRAESNGRTALTQFIGQS